MGRLTSWAPVLPAREVSENVALWRDALGFSELCSGDDYAIVAQIRHTPSQTRHAFLDSLVGIGEGGGVPSCRVYRGKTSVLRLVIALRETANAGFTSARTQRVATCRREDTWGRTGGAPPC